ncbi:MAG: (2Fe-2S)-binding protein [Candidatus Wallbacteria bacterium]|nr:(2Fe-2S)-binding protein [Candidatus Wallbacteria bacterium]
MKNTPKRVLLELEVNGLRQQAAVRPYDVLLDVLREELNLTGTKRGCDMGTCGCCTVLVEGKPVLSCLTLALQCEGKRITTVEGLKEGTHLHPLQECFAEAGGSQCGFCTPGFLMTCTALLEKNPEPSVEEIKSAISGNLCRCTGYVKIVEAIQVSAERLRARRLAPEVPRGR